MTNYKLSEIEIKDLKDIMLHIYGYELSVEDVNKIGNNLISVCEIIVNT